MSLEHAILGFLQYQPYSGYELKKVFDTSVHHFWPADQSQIYRTLARLAERGWVEREVVPQSDRPDRKLYYITTAGRAELQRWLLAPIAHEQARSAELVQIFFAGQLDDEQILGLLEPKAAALRALLAHYAEVPNQAQPYIEELGDPREAFFWLLTLDFGVSMARAYLAWLDKVIGQLRSKHVPTGTEEKS